ncbi:hypothetical protein M9H77_03299 [Catharanthus roseus]|uniref:Uncharacterized protein n=1 Tax=Catharanthus roseus TaxID=4058 RepID=A0ACC0CAV6_CATRO|nr:hypothetical protein M9H77_03299 [Catharanthus roseus]
MNWDDQEANELIHGPINRARSRRSRHMMIAYRRRRGLGERGNNRPQEEIPKNEAWHEDNLFDDYGKNLNIGQEYLGGYYGGQQGDKALDKIKWKVFSFKGESKVAKVLTIIDKRWIPSKAVQKTPYEIWTGKQPSLAFLKIWGLWILSWTHVFILSLNL